jgi:hypothetical protein
MADETNTPGPGLKVIEGGGLPKPPTPEFPEDTRTGIQKRIAPKLGDLKTIVKQVMIDEFNANGALKLGNKEHERRFARALYVEVGRILFNAGVRLHNIEDGSKALAEGCLRADLLAEGVIKQNAPQTAPWVEAVEDAEEGDGEEQEDGDENPEDPQEEIDDS